MNLTTLDHNQTRTRVIALWAAPRCVSTAFEKTFAQRSDTEVVHEPFCDIYYFSQWRISDRFGDVAELRNYSSSKAIDKISSHSSAVVFVKDHAYDVLPYVEREFFTSLTNTFIIRDPEEAMASWYRVNEYPSEAEFGFTALEQIWQMVVSELGQKPIVVDANRFRREPEKILRLYCQSVEVDYDPSMLSWQSGKLQNWNEREAQYHAKWHSTLDKSQGIMPPKREKTLIRPQERAMVARATQIYQKLTEFAL
ncbi:MAG: sulfotransferase family protein [Cyanobacteria bacterium P01_C01_bin.72]